MCRCPDRHHHHQSRYRIATVTRTGRARGRAIKRAIIIISVGSPTGACGCSQAGCGGAGPVAWQGSHAQSGAARTDGGDPTISSALRLAAAGRGATPAGPPAAAGGTRDAGATAATSSGLDRDRWMRWPQGGALAAAGPASHSPRTGTTAARRTSSAAGGPPRGRLGRFFFPGVPEEAATFTPTWIGPLGDV